MKVWEADTIESRVLAKTEDMIFPTQFDERLSAFQGIRITSVRFCSRCGVLYDGKREGAEFL